MPRAARLCRWWWRGSCGSRGASHRARGRVQQSEEARVGGLSRVPASVLGARPRRCAMASPAHAASARLRRSPQCGQLRATPRTRGSRAALCEPAAAVQPPHGASGWGAGCGQETVGGPRVRSRSSSQTEHSGMVLSLLSLHQGARRLSLPGPCARHRGALPPSAMRQPFASEASCVRRLRAPRGSTRGIRHNFQPHPHQRARPQLRPAPHPCPRARQLASPYRQTWRARARGRQPPLPPPPSHSTNHVQRRQPLVGRLQAAPSAAR